MRVKIPNQVKDGNELNKLEGASKEIQGHLSDQYSSSHPAAISPLDGYGRK